ncbi:MAG: acyl-CoA dehydrogenase family protein, partial [Alphaproteobacteria bacterium]
MLLTEEQIMARDMARAFARKELWPNAAQWDRKAEVPRAALAEMGPLGLMGMTVAEEWGGAGTDFMSYILALEEIAAGCGAVSTIMSVNNSPVCAAIEKFGSREQKQRF